MHSPRNMTIRELLELSVQLRAKSHALRQRLQSLDQYCDESRMRLDEWKRRVGLGRDSATLP